jgi:hypothetical protein
MDDLTLGGHLDDVVNDVHLINRLGTDLGLHLNTSKCEVICLAVDSQPSPMLQSFIHVLPTDAYTLLGAPCLAGRMLDTALNDCCVELRRAIERLALLETAVSCLQALGALMELCDTQFPPAVKFRPITWQDTMQSSIIIGQHVNYNSTFDTYIKTLNMHRI